MTFRLTFTMDAASVSVDASPALLDRIEDELLDLRCWQDLRDVSRQHVEWNGSPRASLRLFQAESALGCPEPAVRALEYSVAELERQPDTELLKIAAHVAELSEQWVALARLRALQWSVKRESTVPRVKWREALRRVAESANAGEAVTLAWQHRARDPQLLARVAQWLTSAQRWPELAQLFALESAESANPGRTLVRWMEALHRAGKLGPDDKPVREALSLARNSPELRQVLLKKAFEWRSAWLTSGILMQLTAADPNTLSFVRKHLRWLQKGGHSADAAEFLDRAAAMNGLTGNQARSLRSLLLREGRFASLEDCLRRGLDAAPGDVALMLEMAELADIRERENDAFDWIARARKRLMEPEQEGVQRGDESSTVVVSWIRGGEDSWIARHVQAPITRCPPPRLASVIELLASMTHRRGQFELWSGYNSSDIKSESRVRAPNEVRIAHRLAVFVAHLARQLRPGLIVEIGTAFGVSGMYWVSALEELGAGRFVTFEPNGEWRRIAERNISAISGRAVLVDGTFEGTAAAAGIAEGSIDILSIDAIHTSEAVAGQLEIAAPLLGEKAVVLIDDIKFSPEMYEYWRTIAAAPGIEASFELESRIGVIAGYCPKSRTMR